MIALRILFLPFVLVWMILAGVGSAIGHSLVWAMDPTYDHDAACRSSKDFSGFLRTLFRND